MNVECDEFAKGECAGGGWDRHTKEAGHSCSSWQQIFGVDRSKKSTNSDNKTILENKTSSSSTGSNASYNNDNTVDDNVYYHYRRMHWFYFLIIGWWLGLFMICMIIPLFIRGFVKKCFGYW
jgi:hypothetical protein